MYVTPKCCPKCRYERLPTDSAPDWQCPSCGVAYAKVEGSLPPLPEILGRGAAHARPAAGGGLAKWMVSGLCAVGIGWLVLDTIRNDSGPPRAVALAQAGAEQPQVIMYATSWCPYCEKSREFFARHGIQYIEYDVERDAAAGRENKRLGGGGVPMILVGDQLVSGFNEPHLAALLGPWMR